MGSSTHTSWKWAGAALWAVVLGVALPALANETSCPVDPMDPFDVPVIQASGPNAGKCVNTQRMRSVRLLDPEEAGPFGQSFNEDLVANISHEGAYWVAKVPRDGVQAVIVQTHFFMLLPLLPHVQYRFIMAPGHEVTLLPQRRDLDAAQLAAQAVTLKEFIISAEAVGAGDAHFGLMAGMTDMLVIAYRMVSVSEKTKALTGPPEGNGLWEPGWTTVRQRALALTQGERNKLLQVVLERGSNAGMRRPYHAMQANCATEVWRPLDKTLQGRRPPPSNNVLHEVMQFYPVIVDLPLKERGVWEPNGGSVLPDVMDELARSSSGSGLGGDGLVALPL